MSTLRTVLLCVAIFCFGIGMITMLVSVVLTGDDYTQAYAIHNEISTLSSTDEVISYLTENRISYSLSKTTLSLDDYNVEYTIKEGMLVPCKKLTNLARLDDANDEKIVIETYESNGEYTKHVTLKQNNVEYVKINNNYYIKDTTILNIVSALFGSTSGACFAQFFIRRKE